MSRMRRSGGMVAAVGLAASQLVLAGCAPGARRPTGPVVSPTGIVYEPGTPPRETRYSQTATLYLREGLLDRAIELLREGLDSDPGNAIHFFLAGTAYARIGEYEGADRMFAEAQRIYPAYELEIEPERAAAWAEAFNEGVEAHEADDVEGAIRAWGRAALVYDLRPEAHRNLASVLAGEGRYEEAIDVYRRALAGLERVPATRVLEEEELRVRAEARESTEESLAQLLLFTERFADAEPLLRRQFEREPESIQARTDLAAALVGLGRDAEATEIYATLFGEASLEAPELFSLGVALFRSADFARAGEAFERLTKLWPESRDAWFNYANSLFAAEDWASLVPVGDRLLEVDPLGENGLLLVARALLETGDEEAALRTLEKAEAAPVHVQDLQMRPVGPEMRVRGRVVGNEAEQGTALRLRFTFHGENGSLGSETVIVEAPARGASAPLEVSFPAHAYSYRYEMLP